MSFIKIIIILTTLYTLWNGIHIKTNSFQLKINGIKDSVLKWQEGSEYRKELKKVQDQIKNAKNKEELVEALKDHPNKEQLLKDLKNID